MQIITRKATLVIGNPYIQDGLIAMYDGIWNAGLGKHNSAATTWRDLTGNGYDAVRYGAPSWGDNCAVLHGGIDSFRTGSLFGMPKDVTLEVVYHADIISSPQYIPAGCTQNGGYSIWMTSSSTQYFCKGFAYPLSVSGDGDTVGVRVTRTLAVGTGSGMKVYHDGNLVGSKNGGGPIIYNKNCGFNIGADSSGSPWGIEYPLVGVIYCVRIYNRALRSDEIQHNYEIDRERFTLSPSP